SRLMAGVPAQARERADELRREIAYHDHRYYVLDDPLIGDDAYDALLDELRAREEPHPELRTLDERTQRVGGRRLDRCADVRHRGTRLAPGNARGGEELVAWERRVRHRLRELDGGPGVLRFVTEQKIDGIAISLLYE